MDRERITISIKKRVLDKIDAVIDGSNIRNRSHAIETLTLRGLGEEKSKNAVFILGGEKALDNVPATKHYLKLISEAGFEKAIIAVGFLGDKVKKELGDGSDYGLSLQYSNKGEGSGGALLSLRKYLNSSFAVFSTSEIYDVEIDSLFRFHQSHQSTATLISNDVKDISGIYLFEPEIFSYIPTGFSTIEENLLPKLAKELKLIAWPIIN